MTYNIENISIEDLQAPYLIANGLPLKDYETELVGDLTELQEEVLFYCEHYEDYKMGDIY